MSTSLEIRFVSKYDSVWHPETIFSGFKVRAVLVKSKDEITNVMEMAQLRKRLRRELGTEDVDWFLQENPHTLENELYLPNSGKLVMWKLTDNESFIKLFAFVEQHTDDQAVLDEQERKDDEAEAKRREEARLTRYVSGPKHTGY